MKVKREIFVNIQWSGNSGFKSFSLKDKKGQVHEYRKLGSEREKMGAVMRGNKRTK